jgi:2',3'-cyclic-nucleotide 2'-phosphodiesterase (5'-nucleotidase family)
MRSPLTLGFVFGLTVIGAAQSAVSNNSNFGQSIADELRSASGVNFALFPDAYLKGGIKIPKDLASTLEQRDEAVWVVSLTGAQVRAALEKSIAYYPQSSATFLHISGLNVAYDLTKIERIVSVTSDLVEIEPSKTYKVALPASLARGGLGYFSIWDFKKAEREVSSNLAKLLEGKVVQSSVSRWQSKGSL